MADEQQSARGELAPFQIKAFSVQVRKRIVAAAGNDGTTVGEWLEQAALNQLERERNQVVLAPPTVEGKPPEPPPSPQPDVYFDMGGLANLVAALGQENALTPALKRDVVASVRIVLRRSRGLPPKPRKTPRQLLEENYDWKAIERDGAES